MEIQTNNLTDASPELMTEPELVAFLRIPEVSSGQGHGNVIKNLKRTRGSPSIHICRQLLYQRVAVQPWIGEKVERE